MTWARPKTAFRFRPCPLCGREDYVRAPFTHRRFADGAAAIFICRHCGMTPYVATFESRHRDVLRDEYYERGLYSFPPDHGRQNAALERILDAIDSVRPLRGARFLDVGCGEGRLLERATARGARVRGIEPSRSQAERLRAGGHDVFCGMLDAYEPDHDERWDVVTLIWVLDAMWDPVRSLRVVRRLMAENGVLGVALGSMFATPLFGPRVSGIGGVYPPLRQKRLAIFAPERHFPDSHPFHFTPTTLRACLAVTGFKIQSMTSDGGTRLIVRPTAPSPLADVPLEDWRGLRRYFLRWKAHDVVVRRPYAWFLSTPLPRLPLHAVQFVRRRLRDAA